MRFKRPSARHPLGRLTRLAVHAAARTGLLVALLVACSGGEGDGDPGPSAAGAGQGGAAQAGASQAGASQVLVAGSESGGSLNRAGAGGSALAGAANGGAAGASGQAGSAGSAGGGAAGAGPGTQQWHPVDLSFGGTAGSQLQDSLHATFKGPSGQQVVVPGYFDGADGWKVRFAPTALGAWTYVTTSNVAGLSGKTGNLLCVPNSNPLVHGQVMVDAAHPHYFKYEDGTPYVLMGFEANWLGLLDFGTPAIPKAKSLIDIYASRGFNEVLMNVFAYDTYWKSGKTSADDFGPPAQSPWQGSLTAPDYTRMNPAFFASYDRVVDYLFQHGVVAHIMLKVYNKAVKWPAKGSPSDDLYFKFVLARYQAYPNILWDFSKESNNEPDIAYKSGRLELMRAEDAYHHPVSTHTDTAYYASAASRGLLDFRTDQNQGNFYGTILSHRAANPWPVFNSEFDYQIGNDGGKTYNIASDKLTVFKKACEVTMAGGHLGYYYTYHAWDVVRATEVPDGLDYYKHLIGVLESTAWSELAPADSAINSPGDGRHCLAKEGSEYLVYLAGAGSAVLNVKGLGAGAKIRGSWFDLTSGQEQAIAPAANGALALSNPWPHPALAHLAL